MCDNCINKIVCGIKQDIESDTFSRMGIKFNTNECANYIPADIRAKAHQEFYDKVLNFEDYILPYAVENGVQLYSGRDITYMVQKIAKQLKEAIC